MSYSTNNRSDKALHVRIGKEQGDGLILGDAEGDQRHHGEGEGNHFGGVVID